MPMRCLTRGCGSAGDISTSVVSGSKGGTHSLLRIAQPRPRVLFRPDLPAAVPERAGRPQPATGTAKVPVRQAGSSVSM